jgi:hypothetical protein
MSHSIAIPHHHQPGREHGRAHHLLLSTLLGVLIAALGFATVGAAVKVVRDALAEEAASAHPVMAFPGREVPANWKWEPKGLDVDNMYGLPASPRPNTRSAPPRLDWIREGGAR